MKKLNILKSLILATTLIIGTSFMACSNDDSNDNAPANPSSTNTAGTVSAATTTAGITTATLTTSEGGTYEFTQDSTPSSSIVALSARSVADASVATGTGTWKYKVSGKVKYQGTYKGNISNLGSSAVGLELKVEKAANASGKLVTLKEAKQTEFKLNADTSNFDATIPAITIESAETELTGLQTVDDFVEWLNKYTKTQLGTTFVAGKHVERDDKYTLTENGTSYTISVKTDGTFKGYVLTQQVFSGTYALSSDGKYVVVLIEMNGAKKPGLYELNGTTLTPVTYTD